MNAIDKATKIINVLDHGHVRLVDWMGGDLSISRAARVSYNAPPRQEDTKLIHYLWDNEHTSPFEAVTLTFDVKAPIFVFRQWHRHRTWSFNEVSARYTELPDEFYIPSLEHIGEQSKTSKQARDLGYNPHQDAIQRKLVETMLDSFSVYQLLLSWGCPRELARTVLPVGTYSHMFATVNLMNLFRFCKLRLHKHAQFETRVYAEAMIRLVSAYVAPIATDAFIRRSGMDLTDLRGMLRQWPGTSAEDASRSEDQAPAGELLDDEPPSSA